MRAHHYPLLQRPPVLITLGTVGVLLLLLGLLLFGARVQAQEPPEAATLNLPGAAFSPEGLSLIHI